MGGRTPVLLPHHVDLSNPPSVKLQRYTRHDTHKRCGCRNYSRHALLGNRPLDRAELSAGDKPLAKVISSTGVQKSEACSHRLG
jgi:hypothetical protein